MFCIICGRKVQPTENSMSATCGAVSQTFTGVVSENTCALKVNSKSRMWCRERVAITSLSEAGLFLILEGCDLRDETHSLSRFDTTDASRTAGRVPPRFRYAVPDV